MKNTLLTESKMIAIAKLRSGSGSRSAIFFQMVIAIAIAISNLIKIEIAIEILAIGVMPCLFSVKNRVHPIHSNIFFSLEFI